MLAAAGPAVNFALAGVWAVRLAQTATIRGSAFWAANLLTGLFNLLPVPPLDGSKILLAFLPAKYEYKFAQYEQYIQFILLILLFVGVLDRPINFFINVVYHVLSSIVLLVF